ncbi:MAG: hypothetical protein HQK83_20375 [Fibrobacteria bacterium]|nr:hypothetical protein [Fibrobacteria bacterium]
MTSSSTPHFYLALELRQFPAQAIIACHPAYRTLPFAIILQNPGRHKTSLWACSPAAQRCTITPGMPVHDAKKKCPDLQLLPRNKIAEIRLMKATHKVMETFTPVFSFSSAGNGILDLSGTPLLRHHTPDTALQHIRQALFHTTKLSGYAMGFSGNQVLAQMLAKSAEPNQSIIVLQQNEDDTLHQMDIALLPGISSSAKTKLEQYGLKTVDQFLKLKKTALIKRLGKEGERLYFLVRKQEFSTASPGHQSLQAETVFPYDINDQNKLKRIIRLTVDKLCFKLKTKGLNTGRLTVTLIYTDNKSIQQSIRFPNCTDDFLSLATQAEQLVRDMYTRRVAIKSIHTKASLLQQETRQLSLFDTRWERRQRAISQSITHIRQKNDFQSILSASHITRPNKQVR